MLSGDLNGKEIQKRGNICICMGFLSGSTGKPTQGSNPNICIAGKFFSSWATKEAQEYWDGSLSIFQQIFSTQESNWGLLHYKLILYQLSYQGSSFILPAVFHFNEIIGKYYICIYMKCVWIISLCSMLWVFAYFFHWVQNEGLKQ